MASANHSVSSVHESRPPAASDHEFRQACLDVGVDRGVERLGANGEIDGFARPPRAEESEHFLKDLATSSHTQAERLALAGLVESSHEAQQQPATRDLIELRQLLGQQEWVAPERHDIRTQP